jgi:hypothetical protein
MMEPVESLRRPVELESPTGDAARIAHAGDRHSRAGPQIGAQAGGQPGPWRLLQRQLIAAQGGQRRRAA